MGFFKSINDLKQQAKEIEKTMPPPGERARDASARMAAATQMMAAQTQAANDAMAAMSDGVDVSVTIAEARQVGMVNFDALVDFEVTVMPDGRPPYPATVRQAVPQIQLGQLGPGATLRGRAKSDDPSSVWLDLTSAH